MPEITPPSVVPPGRIPFLPARHFYRPMRARSIDRIVIHSAEVGETLDGAEALMRMCADGLKDRHGNDRLASWHFAVDADSVTQSVHEQDVAYHAPGANANGIGIELCGRARQTVEEWADPYSVRVLELAAWLTAGLCARYSIPDLFVDRAGLLEGRRGITTHAEVSAAFKKSTHWDPGPFFPIDHFMDRVAWWMHPDNRW